MLEPLTSKWIYSRGTGAGHLVRPPSDGQGRGFPAESSPKRPTRFRAYGVLKHQAAASPLGRTVPGQDPPLPAVPGPEGSAPWVTLGSGTETGQRGATSGSARLRAPSLLCDPQRRTHKAATSPGPTAGTGANDGRTDPGGRNRVLLAGYGQGRRLPFRPFNIKEPALPQCSSRGRTIVTRTWVPIGNSSWSREAFQRGLTGASPGRKGRIL